jgi:branched-chain amino acid transport system substrate-binding protein
VKSVKELSYVGDAFAPMDTTDWSPYIARARAAGATAIMVSVTLGTPMLQFLQQATDFGLTKEAQMVAPIGLPDWLVAKLGRLSTSVISAGSWAAWRYEDADPTTKEFNEAFFKANGRVAGMQAVQAASAARMLYSAIAKANSTDPDQIVHALETIEVRTPVGPLKFQQGGRQAMVPLFLGPYEAVSPPRYGAEFAQRVESAFPASKSLTKSAAESGCKLK